MQNISRRAFVQLTGLAIGASLAPAELATPRDPFVVQGEQVDSIVFHLWETPHAPTGPLFVHEVLPWDGRGYPIVLRQWNYGNKVLLFDGWYDFEWANLLREAGGRGFWKDARNRQRYPNIHSYIREQRFGEHPSVMRQRMESNRLVYAVGDVRRPPCPPGRPLMAAA